MSDRSLPWLTMPASRSILTMLVVMSGLLLLPSISRGAEDAPNETALKADSEWRILTPDDAAQRIAKILQTLGATGEVVDQLVAQLNKDWAKATDPLSLELDVIQTAQPSIRDLFTRWRGASDAFESPDALTLPKELVADLRLWIGRDLARQRLYDEGLQWLNQINASETCDPATLLFFRAVCRHTLWSEPEKAYEDVRQLLRRESELPARYRMTARLMQVDLKPRDKPDPLDEVSRMMQDVGRRLDLGRAGEPEVKRETEIIEKLDKLIEDLEKQLQQQQQQRQSAAGNPNGQPQGQAMQDSQIAGGSGAGDVDPRDLGENKSWGDLPPAQREEALQKMSQQLPSHYREVIEGYFRKLAVEPRSSP